jgi:hypothetical protein
MSRTFGIAVPWVIPFFLVAGWSTRSRCWASPSPSGAA